uniref:(northern house mosquito) hypothetical protein n=1 Tax=Culex pipiens TaxID=7175 RepID=A0A8D8IRE7_CULPI
MVGESEMQTPRIRLYRCCLESWKASPCCMRSTETILRAFGPPTVPASERNASSSTPIKEWKDPKPSWCASRTRCSASSWPIRTARSLSSCGRSRTSPETWHSSGSRSFWRPTTT